MAEQLHGLPRKIKRRQFFNKVVDAVKVGTGAYLGASLRPVAEQAGFVPQEQIKPKTATNQELDMSQPPGYEYLCASSRCDAWDNKPVRIYSKENKNRQTELIGEGKDLNGKSLEGSILPMDEFAVLSNARLSPDGKRLLFSNDNLWVGNGAVRIGHAFTMYDNDPSPAYLAVRPDDDKSPVNVSRLPSAKAVFDRQGRVFVLGQSQVTNFTLELNLGNQHQTMSTPYIEVKPTLMVYDKSDFPDYEATLNFNSSGSVTNKRWASLLTGGKITEFNGIFSQFSNEDMAISPDGSYICVPTMESFFWAEEDIQYTAGGFNGIQNLIISKAEYNTQGRKGMFLDINNFVRISHLEYPDLHGNADICNVAGVLPDNVFIIEYKKEVKSTEKSIENPVVSMAFVKPGENGNYQVWYVTLPKVDGSPKQIIHTNKGIILETVKNNGVYSNQLLNPDQIDEILTKNPWSAYSIENGNIIQDTNKPSYTGPEDFLKQTIPEQPPYKPSRPIDQGSA